MNSELLKLNSLIEFLRIHSIDAESETKLLTKEKINELIDELKNKRIHFLSENIIELKQKIKKNYKKLRVSALSLMKYKWNENSHSNILDYLFNYNSFKYGSKLLSQLVLNTDFPEKDILAKKILNENYSTYREYAISKGRIDLFVLDEKENFAIIIENKILAEIGESIDEDENKITQLEKYEKWSQKNYPGYIRLNVFLNFSDYDDETPFFYKISYKRLFDLLNDLFKLSKPDDNIFEEYLLLLDSLLNAERQDLAKVKKLANSIIENKNPEISLTDYFTLKSIFYD